MNESLFILYEVKCETAEFTFHINCSFLALGVSFNSIVIENNALAF
jgi:hypothetical protein